MIKTRVPEEYEGAIKRLLSESRSVCILGHHNPDGDAIGSALGMYAVLKNAAYDVSVIMPNSSADFLSWLPNFDQIILFKDQSEQAEHILLHSDLIICVDFNEAKRTEAVETSLLKSNALKIMIDHHPDPGNFADFTFSFTDYSSAAEIVFEFIDFAGLHDYFDKNAATCIYTGIMTDTLNFSVNSSGERTFMNIAKLLSFGIDKETIYDKVYNNFSFNRLRLVGYLLHKKMSLLEKHAFAYIILTKEEMRSFHFNSGDHEGIVNMPLSVKGVDASLLAIEKDDFVKISLRSKFDIDVNHFARQYFNGGGHTNAAGGKLYMDIGKVNDYIISALETYFSK